jgi:hypothetical protein
MKIVFSASCAGMLGLAETACTGLAACLASVPAGLMAVKRMEGMDILLEEVLVMLEKQVTSWEIQRTVLLYKFQPCLLADKEGDKLSKVVDQMASLGDKKGLVSSWWQSRH